MSVSECSSGGTLKTHAQKSSEVSRDVNIMSKMQKRFVFVLENEMMEKRWAFVFIRYCERRYVCLLVVNTFKLRYYADM